MNLEPRTGVPEVNSYFDKSTVSVRRARCSSSVGVCDFPANVLALIHANIGYYYVDLSMIVRRCAAGIPHGSNTAKIGDALGVGIYWVERKWSYIGRPGKELVVKPISWRRRLIWLWGWR